MCWLTNKNLADTVYKEYLYKFLLKQVNLFFPKPVFLTLFGWFTKNNAGRERRVD